MSREERVVSISILLLFFLGLESLIRHHALVLILPLHEVLFTVVAFLFITWNRNMRIAVVVIAFSIASLLATPIVWNFLYSSETMQVLMAGPTLDIFRLIAALLLIFSAIAISIKQHSRFGYIGLSLFIAGVLAGHIFHLPLLEWAGLLVMTISLLIRPVFVPFHWLWFLLTVLQGMTYASLFFSNI